MQQMESTYAKHLRNQEMRTMSRERLNKRKNEREIVKPIFDTYKIVAFFQEQSASRGREN